MAELEMSADQRPDSGGLADRIYERHAQIIYRRADRTFAVLMPVQWMAGLLAALIISPRTWTGANAEVHPHVWAALVVGGLITSLPVGLALLRPGRLSTRMVVAAGQMLTSALLIHLTGGRIETHFHIFGSLAFLAFYRDWRVFVPAAVVIFGDHLIRGVYWPQSVYGVVSASPWRSFEHIGWVVFEEAFLVISCLQSQREMREIAKHRAELELTNDEIEAKVVERTAMLEASEARFRGLLESAPDAMIITNGAGRIALVNWRAEAMFGFSRGELLGEPVEVLLPERFRKGHVDLVAGFVDNPSSRTMTGSRDLIAATKDGREIPVEISLAPMRTKDGLYISAAVRDVTERKHVEEALIEAKESAVAAEHAKGNFLACMSHEIRTPLNGVIGMTGLLLDTDLDDEQLDFATTVRTCGQSLLGIINDILDFSKIEAGKLDLEIIDFDLRTTIEELIDILAQRAREKGLELICLVDPEVHSRLRGDPGRLRQVLVNLAYNAIKFTDSGEIMVRAQTLEDSEGATRIRFDVADTGMGIPEDQVPKLFRSFSQLDDSSTRRHGGSGLGLAICKRLVGMMGGSIGVESAEGLGSTFWFELPFSKQTDESVEVAADSEADLNGVRVLVVDDNGTNRKLCGALLRNWGCQCEQQSRPELGLEAMLSAAEAGSPFQVALIDSQMPGMDGMTLGEEVKNDPRLGDISLALMTSAGRRGEAAEAETAGFEAYLNKPIKHSVLYDCLVEIVGRRDRQEQECAKPKPARLITSHSLAEAKQPRRILVAEDNHVNQKVALKLLDKLGYRADAVANGTEALRALESIPYDLVLMDCQMPEMDGYEATAEIRRIEGEDQHTIIVAMTANAMIGDSDICLAAGMDDYLAKPVQTHELGHMLERWLGRPIAAQEQADSPSAPPEEKQPSPFDMQRLEEIADGDQEFMKGILADYLNVLTQSIRDIDTAILGKDIDRISALAHGLKGASGSVGANAVEALARKLEADAKENNLGQAQNGLEELNAARDSVRRFVDA